MRNFSINLQNSDTKSEIPEFFSNLSSYFYAPYILQPTRLAIYSKTLINNTFINTIQFCSYSGNFTFQIPDHLLDLKGNLFACKGSA